MNTNAPKRDRDPGLMELVGKMSQKEQFEVLRKANEERILNDPNEIGLADQMRAINSFAEGRQRQNIIKASQFAPYVELFTEADPKDAALMDKRRKLFKQYTEHVINPMEITIILSEDGQTVVGIHDRLLTQLASADPSDDNARIIGEVNINQERKREDAAGAGLKSLGTAVIEANHADNNPEMIRKRILDSILVKAVQKLLNQAIADGKPGIPFTGGFTMATNTSGGTPEIAQEDDVDLL